MKLPVKRKRKKKVPRLFKLRYDLDCMLRRYSKRSNLNQTKIIELSLDSFFAVKR